MNFRPADIECIFAIHFNEAVISCSELQNGSMTFKYEVCLEPKIYILKIYPASRSFVANKEYHLLKAIAMAPVKAPKVCFTGNYQNASYLIYEKVPGEELDFNGLSYDEKNSISSQIAENIFGLSTIRYGQCGSLIENEPSFLSWRRFLSHNIAEGYLNLARTNLFDDLQLKHLKQFMLDRLDHIEETQHGVVWSDLSQDNIIVTGSQLSGFIDFEGCFQGDPLLSLGYLFAREGESEFFNFMQRQFIPFFPANKDHVYFYALLRLLRISKYLLEPLPTGRERGPLHNYFKGIKPVLDYIKE